MMNHSQLLTAINERMANYVAEASMAFNEVTLTCNAKYLKLLMQELKDDGVFCFDELIDLCVVDYLNYGVYDFETNSATEHGFSRGVERQQGKAHEWNKPRFAVVYHLLSTKNNVRLRVKTYLEDESLIIPSIHELWKGANWFEREAYDLYGVLFEGHPDLRRLLTDYGFIGHPFRKDFPLSGHVEMHYNAKLGKVVYAPVEITPRIGVPKVIRDDSRYVANEGVE